MATTDPLEQNSLALRAMSNDRLLRDYTVNVELDITRQCLDMSPDTVALRGEILRRMMEGGRP